MWRQLPGRGLLMGMPQIPQQHWGVFLRQDRLNLQSSHLLFKIYQESPPKKTVDSQKGLHTMDFPSLKE
jgi:hypothetical protein